MSSSLFCTRPLRGGGGNGDVRSLKYPVALFLIVFAVIAVAFAVTEFSDEVDASTTIDDLKYDLDSTEHTAKVVGYEGTPWNLEVPSSVTYEGVAYSVKSIGERAFYNCTYLTSVIIPDSVTTLYDYAFQYCDSLESVIIPDTVTSIKDYAFYDCESLVSVIIGNSVETIGYQAFYGCESLVSVTFPDSVKFIDSYAFNGTSIESLIIPDTVTSIGTWAFNHCTSLVSVTIGNSVETIGRGTFNSCTSLESVTIPNSVTSIGNNAFQYCTSLESVTIPGSVTSIGNQVFRNCTSLESVTIGNSLKTIGNQAFYECNKLVSVTVPGSVTSIGSSAFEGCYKLFEVVNLSSLNITKGSTDNGYVAYYAMNVFKSTSEATVNTTEDGFVYGNSGGVWYLLGYTGEKTTVVLPDKLESHGYEIYKYAFRGDTALDSVTVPDSVTSIGDDAFYGCKSLDSVTIGNSVKSIGNNAFQYCNSLASVTIPGSVTSIGDYAFLNCAILGSVTIGDSVKSIGSKAFYGCNKLVSVTVPDSVTSIGSSAFEGCYKLFEVVNLSSLNITKGSTDNGYVAYYAMNVFKSTSEATVKTTEDGFVYGNSGGVWYLLGYTGEKTTVVLPDKLESHGYEIYKYAFRGNTALDSVTVPDSVTSIGDDAFYGCKSLDSVTIGNSVKSIGNNAFQYCNSLASVTVPGSVTSIGDYAFCGCTSLGIIVFETDTWNIEIGEDQFSLGTQLKSISAIVYSPSNVANGKLDSYRGGYTSFTYLSSLLKTVTFNANGGSCDTVSMETGADGKLASLPDATRDRYTFGGWYTQAEGGEEITTSYVFTQNTTVYAHWNVIHVTAVTLDKTLVTLEAGNTAKLVATVTPSDATVQTVTWTTSDASIAAVSSDGTITAIKAGTVTIKAVADGKEAACTVKVNSLVFTVTFNANGGSCDTVSMETGADGKLASLPDAIRDRYTFGGWYTQAEGGEKITTSYVFIRDTAVYAHWSVIHVTSVTLDKTSVALDIGKTVKLISAVSPSDATFPAVTWTSSDESTATVSSDGTVTAVKAGTVTIKASADGKEASCTVTVNGAPSPEPTPPSGGGIPAIAIVGAVLAIIAIAGVAIFMNKR